MQGWSCKLSECTVTDVSRLGPIKQQCPEHITFEQIKVVIAILHRRFGVQVDEDSDVLTASAAVNFTNVLQQLLCSNTDCCVSQCLYMKLSE